MLKFDDFFHLPQLDPLIAQLIADRHGVVVVAGLDAPVSGAAHDSGVLPSGRTALFRALVGEMLQAAPHAPTVLVAEDRDAVRLPHSQYRHVTRLLVQPPKTYTEQVAQALRRQPDLLVIDQLHA